MLNILRIEKSIVYFVRIEEVCIISYVSQKVCFLEHESYIKYVCFYVSKIKVCLFATYQKSMSYFVRNLKLMLFPTYRKECFLSI